MSIYLRLRYYQGTVIVKKHVAMKPQHEQSFYIK